MLMLYFSPGTACLAPHFLLEELGAPYELVLVDTARQEHQQVAYLKLNPNGKIPLLIADDLLLTESAAICFYLADRYDSKGLLPPFKSKERAQATKWMMYLTNTLQAELLSYFYPDRLTHTADAQAQVKAKAEERVAQMLVFIDASLAQSGGDFLLGNQLSIADLFLFMLCRWTRHMQKPARTYPQLGPFLERMFARPSIVKAFEMEGIVAPYY